MSEHNPTLTVHSFCLVVLVLHEHGDLLSYTNNTCAVLDMLQAFHDQLCIWQCAASLL